MSSNRAPVKRSNSKENKSSSSNNSSNSLLDTPERKAVKQNGTVLKPALKPRSFREKLGNFIAKKVSFGSSKGTVVETFVYDSPNSATLDDRIFTRSLEPPSKIKVTATDSQVPSYIAPPTAVGSSDSSENLKAPPSSSNRTLPSGVVQFSPPLPSLKKMEEEKDNPFRPDGELNAEVEPIVEVYKKRPFPEDRESADGSRPISPETPKSDDEKSPKTNSKWKWKGDGKVKEGEKENGIAVDGEAPIKPSHIDLQLEATPGGDQQNAPLIGEAQKTTLTSPKAGKVELVHLEEKKRKCGCCTIQ